MRFRKRTGSADGAGKAGSPGAGQPARPGTGPARWQQAQKEIRALRRRVDLLENEVQEARRLSKRLAEITDVVAEVLLPAEQRDEERLRALLERYESNL